MAPRRSNKRKSYRKRAGKKGGRSSSKSFTDSVFNKDKLKLAAVTSIMAVIVSVVGLGTPTGVEMKKLFAADSYTIGSSKILMNVVMSVAAIVITDTALMMLLKSAFGSAKMYKTGVKYTVMFLALIEACVIAWATGASTLY